MISTFRYLCWTTIKSNYAFREIGSRIVTFRISIILRLALDDLFDANEVENDLKP